MNILQAQRRRTFDEVAMQLTGRFNFLRSWRGKVVLHVEENVQPRWFGRGSRSRWRPATATDLMESELRPLVDLERRPGIWKT